MTTDVIDWLLDGDPVIRWQTMRDLLDASEQDWIAEQGRTVETGWGKSFLENLGDDGNWPVGRWTGTVWTLLQVIDCGVLQVSDSMKAAAVSFLDRNATAERCAHPDWLKRSMDLCHIGFWLRIGAASTPGDPRLQRLVQVISELQMQDGGWNCRIRVRPQTHHSSFHTTFNVLEALREAKQNGVISAAALRELEAPALEFMLKHQMYLSDHTGSVIDERFCHLSYPSYWHYTVLRGLDYMRDTPEISDPRLEASLNALMSKRLADGKWPLEKRMPGSTLFDMERFGGASRWNTLRALRVLKCASKSDLTGC